jgi:preprotein translocase subunit YajC
MLGELAYAQSAAPADGLQSFLQSQIPFFIIIIALGYLLLIRPQRQEENRHRTMLANLKRNDEVTTNGGILGRIVGLTETVVTLEVAPNVQVRVERSQIKSLAKSPAGDEKERRREKDKEKGKS